ncbi:anti-sigma factor [Cryobacterium sp. CG_9.6]|uniref:anti-sigma factor n=1 Tax=Cryobacterium sp. CG_9.6 TaxID=2760710 RepID=UPI002473C1D5|nr:anti-sigma factor [Cryobacterium sp. CG_9.6]MDH6237887.1 anti-sigma-K factor RskA [Cryobacterium sp. CG_9.6]
MTDKRDKRDGESVAELAGAYALDALSDAERADFQAYLSTSGAARAEAAELSDTAVALGLAAAPVTPSAALRSNLMAMIASTPQLAPLSATPVIPTAVNTHASAPTAPVDDLVVPVTTAGSGAASVRAQQRWFQRPAQLLLAAAAAVVLFVGGTFAGQAVNNNQFVEQQAAGMVQITAASDSERAVTTTADGHDATLVWSNALGLSAVLLDDLPSLGSDRDYQLWYINAAGAASAGTFDSTGSGTSWRVLDGAMHTGDTVGITVEPRGGSEQPTTAPIVAFQST